MAPASDLTRLLGIRHPILLAPMGGVSGGALASAVGAAGGFGMIGGGYADPVWLRRELALADPGAIGIGFITWHLQGREAVLHEALERRPKAVFLSFGDAAPYVPAIKAAGALLLCQVQTVADARAAARLGADVIVAQGSEAGGHGAARGTLALVPAVVDAVAPLPVVAAGGIADGRGLAAVLMLGAQAALVGTRFMVARESLLHGRGKARLVEAAGDDTLRTGVFDIVRGYAWPAPYTGRALRNAFTARWHGREDALRQALPAEQARYAQAAQRGDFDDAALFAGEGVDLVRAVEPAARIVEALVAEAERALART
jgi:nitronate monooxygenase